MTAKKTPGNLLRRVGRKLRSTCVAPLWRYCGRCDPSLYFLHIPKTGGTYVTQLESDDRSVIGPIESLGHSYVIVEPGQTNPLYRHHDSQRASDLVHLKDDLDRPVFTVVRNVFAWLVSYYFHCGGHNPRYHDPEHYDYDNAQKGFDYLLRVIMDREDLWPNRKFIFVQNFASDGSLVPRYILRTRTLDDDLAWLADEFQLDYKGPRTKQRRGGHRDYRDYYSDALISDVRETWSREIELYGFEFDGEEGQAVLERAMAPEVRGSVRYLYGSDDLEVGSTEKTGGEGRSDGAE
jgi:hypothetical protein